MNSGTIVCLIFAAVFGILAVIFAFMKGKAAILISGFNMLPSNERENYDKAMMSLDMRNALILWMVIFLLGAVCSFFISNYSVLVAFIVWLIVFMKNVSLDARKGFEKYKWSV